MRARGCHVMWDYVISIGFAAEIKEKKDGVVANKALDDEIVPVNAY